MNSQIPQTRDVVLVGGGHAHALLLRRWGMAPLPGARLTLIDPNPKAPYTGMLPGHVAGHYPRDALDIDLVRLARFAGARLVEGRATGIDRAARSITVEGRSEIAYDLMSIDIGITSAMDALPGFAAHGIGAKPLGPYAARWAGFVDAVAQGRAAPRVAVIGAGVAGVELALAMRHRLAQVSDVPPHVSVLDAGEGLEGTARGTRKALLRAMRDAGITLSQGVAITRVTTCGVTLSDGQEIPADLVVGAAGARPWGWLAQTDLPLEDGFIRVDETLRVLGDDTAFAVGDCAHLSHAPRPKAGVYAVRAAPVLYDNLRAALTGGASRAFRPQGDFLKLVSLGDKRAVADKAGIGMQLPGLWWWKDRIDQAFMQQFRELPAMPAPDLPKDVADGVHAEMSDHPVICGGCGAKVGPGALNDLLHSLPQVARDDVRSVPGDDAGVIALGGERQVISTDHLRGFSLDPWQVARIAANHALGDVWAMGATPQAALVNIVLPRLSERLQRRTLAEIMSAASEVMTKAGAAIIGGHTTQGSELTVGFTVTGLCRDAPVGLAGARPGDALILTKPVGTGVILAAEMAGRADGAVVARAFHTMARSLARDAHALRGAHAMTDVTGFGLAGHALAICRASGCGADLVLDAVPLLEGAEALLEQGVSSSLHAANRAYAGEWMAVADGPAGPRREALFDPQTAGGLLAAVAPDQADAVLAALARDGIAAARIGTTTEGPPRLTLS